MSTSRKTKKKNGEHLKADQGGKGETCANAHVQGKGRGKSPHGCIPDGMRGKKTTEGEEKEPEPLLVLGGRRTCATDRRE